MRNNASCLLTLSLAMFSPVTLAQIDEINIGFRQLSPDETLRLRAILAEPVPQGALYETLRRHFRAKDVAAIRLGDYVAREAILRERVRLVPDDVALHNLGVALLERSEIEEGNVYLKEAIDKASSLDQKAFSTAVLAFQMYLQFRNDAARTLVIDVRRMIDDLEKLGQSTPRRVGISRCRYMVASTQSLLEARSGRFSRSLAAAVDAEQHARRAMTLASGFVGGETDQAYITFDIAMALGRRIETEIALGRLHAAERTIADYLRLSNELKFHQGYKSHIYRVAAGLRFAQRERSSSRLLLRRKSQLARHPLVGGEREREAADDFNLRIPWRQP